MPDEEYLGQAENTRTVCNLSHRPSERPVICSIGFCKLHESRFIALVAQLIIL
jgi:hypothetical protein